MTNVLKGASFRGWVEATSVYSDHALALRLRTTERVIAQARVDVLELDLIPDRVPLAHVLSLQALATERHATLMCRH